MMEILTLINEIVKQIRDLCSSFSPEQEATFDEIETKVREVMLEIGRTTVETIIRVRGTGYTNETIQTPSGEIAEYRENRTRTIKTLMGPVEIQRAYYHIGKVDMFPWMSHCHFHRSNTHMPFRIR